MAKVGKPLVDIDIQGEIKEEDLAADIGEGKLYELWDTHWHISDK